MDIKKIVLEITEEILGLPQEDMENNMDLNLLEEGLIDSVSSASMITYIEERINKEIDLQKINPEDFKSLNSIISAIERML